MPYTPDAIEEAQKLLRLRDLPVKSPALPLITPKDIKSSLDAYYKAKSFFHVTPYSIERLNNFYKRNEKKDRLYGWEICELIQILGGDPFLTGDHSDQRKILTDAYKPLENKFNKEVWVALCNLYKFRTQSLEPEEVILICNNPSTAKNLVTGLETLHYIYTWDTADLRKILYANPLEASLIAKGITILNDAGFSYEVVVKLASQDPKNILKYAEKIHSHGQAIQEQLFKAIDPGSIQEFISKLDSTTKSLNPSFSRKESEERDATMTDERKKTASPSARTHGVFSASHESKHAGSGRLGAGSQSQATVASFSFAS